MLMVVVAALPCQGQTEFHRIDAQSPHDLRSLFEFDGERMPLLSAHRGGSVPSYPENCIETFEHSLRHAFCLLEIDLRYTKDGQIVLHHDATLDRTTTGTGPIADRTLKELKQLYLKDNSGTVTEYRIPTLDEALQWARGKTIVILDKKVVPVEICVQKIQEQRAQAYAMVMAYGVDDIRACHHLDPDIMMEVMIGNHQRYREFEESGVMWNRIVAFIGHTPPDDHTLVEKIHAKGVCCMAGTSRNLDRRAIHVQAKDRDALASEYLERLNFGVDLIETDLPIQVSSLLYQPIQIPANKTRFFFPPKITSK
tara:strand:+ start:57550 stop:58482 length:933 start_codon:yes stop_codon:yes gene_type:complete